MKIGIDIDNVISNFNDELLKEYLEHDKTLRNTGIVNPDVYITRGMFDWTQEENDDFYYKNIQRIAMNLKPIKNSKEMIDKLKSEGNEIIIISGRDNGEYTNPYEMTEKWLKENKIYYDKLVLTDAKDKSSKAKYCKEHNIDIMIDDSKRILQEVNKTNTKTFIMINRYNKDDHEGIEGVVDWNDLYDKIESIYHQT